MRPSYISCLCTYAVSFIPIRYKVSFTPIPDRFSLNNS